MLLSMLSGQIMQLAREESPNAFPTELLREVDFCLQEGSMMGAFFQKTARITDFGELCQGVSSSSQRLLFDRVWGFLEMTFNCVDKTFDLHRAQRLLSLIRLATCFFCILMG